ncbi:MarR family transcriptional regulator [Halobaculum litoreum]|uniref:MarR family transcriptional regulator n=1 Tax=Halobaculum litoreum TaxID=3031998 RepID=A0ABD5XRN2_9EURY
MSDDASDGDLGVLRHKREATRYRILVEIAERQPAVSQREIADAIGVTAQAVSEHLGDLAEGGFVDREGRGRYRVTKEGVDWLISRTDELREYLDHVTGDVLGGVEVETALADGPVDEGDRVTLSMRDGVLHARRLDGDDAAAAGGTRGGATALAVTAAEDGTGVGVAEFDGVVDYDLGAVTAVVVPAVRDGGAGSSTPSASPPRRPTPTSSPPPARRRWRRCAAPTASPTSASGRSTPSTRRPCAASTCCSWSAAATSRPTPTPSAAPGSTSTWSTPRHAKRFSDSILGGER